jgi:hypothetical protein
MLKVKRLESQIILKVLGARKPKGLNRTIKLAMVRHGTRYTVETHDMWWIVVEIRCGKHDSTSWIGTQQENLKFQGKIRI